MKKYIVLIIICIITIFIMNFTNRTMHNVEAVYLIPPNGVQLSLEELENYPEILVVTTFQELKESVSSYTSIWIDRNAIDMIVGNWLHEESQKYLPIVVIGYNNALYCFRDKLTGYDIEGPKVNWVQNELEGGYSVWKLIESNNTSISAFMKGFDAPLDVKEILKISNRLIDGKLIE